jgi:L-ascorbate metabolism protein UlaG (beta-lactamase superfamily)
MNPQRARLLSRTILLRSLHMPRTIRSLASLLLACLGLFGCYMPTVARSRGYHPSDADLTVTRLVHGSAILDFRETRILLDPWYSPTPPLGQSVPIGLSLENLPPLRGLLITQQRDDHFDAATLRNLPDKALRVIVCSGLGPKVRAMGYEDVVELQHWERSQIGSVIVTAVPAGQSAVGNGYVLEGNSLTVYVAGDTPFDEVLFRQLAERYPHIDLALLPIGGVRIFGSQVDMTPQAAAEAFTVLHPQHVIPYDYELTGPFPIFASAATAPQQFLRSVGPKGREAVVVLEPGESWHHYR